MCLFNPPNDKYDIYNANSNTDKPTNNKSSYDEAVAKNNNKLTHIRNGNTEHRDFTVVQINSGNGK